MTSSTITPVITPERLAQAHTYASYRHLIDDLQKEGKTTGPQQSEMLSNYTRLNVQRMERIDKKIELLPQVQAAAKAVAQPYVWLVLTEGWCGDAAQLVPVIEAVAQASEGRISTRYLLRDDNLDLMDRYLTNGGRAIPKLIVLHPDNLTEVTDWGPRPAGAQDLFLEMKAAGATHEEFAEKLHGWYAKDKTITTQHELLAVLQAVH